MKKLLSILCLLLFTQMAVGQSLKMRIANRLYNDLHFAEAKRHYEEIVAKNPDNIEAEEKLAHCYRRMNDSEKAEFWYAKVVDNERAEAEDKLYYAQALAKNGKYKESKKWYRKYAEAVEKDSRGGNFYEAYNNLHIFYSDSGNYQVEYAAFNSEASDFSPMFYEGKLIFSSNRHGLKNKPVQRTFNWTKTAFLDLYIVEEEGSEPKLFHENLNSKYHEGPLAFFKDHKKMIFTRNNYFEGKYRESDKGVNKLKMYLAEREGEDWRNLTEFPYNDDQYSMGHPTFSPDYQWLYFASDMPGGYGGVDLYKCKVEGETFGEPINLGAAINTEGDDMFPYIDAKGNLYFASDGHVGMGGLDIFLATKKGEEQYDDPFNVGYPLNSSQDDFGLIFDEKRGIGYFTSHDRTGGSGDDDIFKFYRKESTVPPVLITGVTIEQETTDTLGNVSVVVKNLKTGEVEDHTTEPDGSFELSLVPGDPYEIVAIEDGFERTVKIIEEEESEKVKNGEVISVPLKPSSSREKFDQLEVFHIYYDYNKHTIREDAQEGLEEVIDILEQYEEATVTLRAHTDKRSTNKYNDWLSSQRAQAAQQYLIKGGIEAGRIKTVAIGENELLDTCEECSEQGHQNNRRTEFIFTWKEKTLRSKPLTAPMSTSPSM